MLAQLEHIDLIDNIMRSHVPTPPIPACLNNLHRTPSWQTTMFADPSRIVPRRTLTLGKDRRMDT